jgi:hypothetical protein
MMRRLASIPSIACPVAVRVAAGGLKTRARKTYVAPKD